MATTKLETVDNIIFASYIFDEKDATSNKKNHVLETFFATERFNSLTASNNNADGNMLCDIKNAWIHPGGYQSWAPGFELAPGQRQLSLKTPYIRQWNTYLTFPKTDAKLYRNKNIVLAQFISYFRVAENYFVMASVGNVTENTKPPVQFIIDKKRGIVSVTVFDDGKNWQVGEEIARVCFFVSDSFFACHDTLKKLYSTERFSDIQFLGKTPGGWESWYNHYANINESLILKDLDALCKTENFISLAYLKQNKPTVFQIDDGWEKSLGDWDADVKRFPSGLLPVAKKIDEKGLIPGLWIAPFIIDLRSETAKKHPGWILRDKKGNPVSAGFNPLWGAAFGKAQPRLPYTFFALDIRRPDVLSYLDNVMDKAINEWGFRYLKLDFLYAGLFTSFEDYDKALKVLTSRKKNNKEDAVAYLGCGMPFENSINYFPLSRLGCDTFEHFENTQCKRMNWNGRNSAYLNMLDTIGRALWNGSIFASDPDVLFVRNENCSLTHNEKILIATVAILFGSQLMYSDDPESSCSIEEINLSKEILAIQKKYEKEEFSATPILRDVFFIKSRSEKYFGYINLSDKECKVESEKRDVDEKIDAHSVKIFDAK